MTTLYCVTAGTEKRLIYAETRVEAIQYCAHPKYYAYPAKGYEVAELMAAGVKPEHAKPDAP